MKILLNLKQLGAMLCLVAGSLALVWPAHAQEPDHAIHEELRAVMHTMTQAINTGEFDQMLPALSAQIRATPTNQEFLSGREEVSRYFKKWFGKGGYLKKLDIQLTADVLTELSPDKTWGVAYGKGVEKYVLTDGRPYEIHTRWTATMVKEADGKWRIRSIHIGTDFLNNPILDQAESAVYKMAAAGAAGGLLLGLLGGWLIWRRRKQVG